MRCGIQRGRQVSHSLHEMDLDDTEPQRTGKYESRKGLDLSCSFQSLACWFGDGCEDVYYSRLCLRIVFSTSSYTHQTKQNVPGVSQSIFHYNRLRQSRLRRFVRFRFSHKSAVRHYTSCFFNAIASAWAQPVQGMIICRCIQQITTHGSLTQPVRSSQILRTRV